MTNEEFQSLLDGPLRHPLLPFTLIRLVMALRAVVEATGEAGARALREHCEERERLDRFKSGEDEL